MRLLVTGAGGMLARALAAEARARHHEVIALAHHELDVTDAPAVLRAVTAAHPHAVLHCAAYTRVDDAEMEPERALAVNAAGTRNLAVACAESGSRLVYPSSDYVFDGRAREPYTPDSTPAPISAYGESKLAGELAAREAPDHLVVRTAWLYGAGGRNFVSTILTRARTGEPLRVVDDQRGSPTWTVDLGRALLDLLAARAPVGVYHAANAGSATWYELAREAIELCGIACEVRPVTTAEVPRPAARPAFSVLDCSATEALIGPMPDWRDALSRAIRLGLR